MGDRITQRDLEAVCARINRTVNGGEDGRTNGDGRWATGTVRDGKYQQIPNIYYIDGAYGGVALYRMCAVDANGESHGVNDVFGYHMPKRDLYNQMQAFLSGIEAVA